MRLKDKSALITGSASGIGEATAKRFAREGAAVVVVDINDEGGNRVVGEIRKAGGTAEFVHADVGKLPDIDRMIKFAIDKFGQLDILHNNVGDSIGRGGTNALDLEAEAFERAAAARAARHASKTPPRLVTNPTILTGLLKCGHCGAGMTLATGKSGRYKYYKCTTKMSKGVALCDAPNIPMEKLDGLVLSRLAEKEFTPARVQLMLKQLQKNMKDAKSQEESQLGGLQSEFKKLEQQIERLYEAVEKGLLPLDDTLTRRSQRLQARRQELLIEIAGTRQKVHLPVKAIGKRQAAAFCAALRNKLMDRDAGFGKRYLSLLVDEVRIEGNQATMRGSHAALVHAMTSKGTVVPSLQPSWRPQRDSNPRCRRESCF